MIDESHNYPDKMNSVYSTDSKYDAVLFDLENIDTSCFNFDISLSRHNIGIFDGMRTEVIIGEDKNIFRQETGQFSNYSHASVSDFSVFWNL